MDSKTTKIIIIASIVAAIVLILLIVGLIFVTKNEEGTINSPSPTMDDMEIAAFNSRFLAYEGNNVRGSQVNALLATIEESNKSSEQQVGFMIMGGSEDNRVNAQDTYSVACSTDDETGFVNFVTIVPSDESENSNNSNNSNNSTQETEATETTSESNNESSSLIDSLSSTETETFNARLTAYEGDSINGANVNALLQTIRQNNEANPDRQIRAMASVNNWDYDNNRADLQSNYKVTCETDSQTGYVNVVKIEDAN